MRDARRLAGVGILLHPLQAALHVVEQPSRVCDVPRDVAGIPFQHRVLFFERFVFLVELLNRHARRMSNSSTNSRPVRPCEAVMISLLHAATPWSESKRHGEAPGADRAYGRLSLLQDDSGVTVSREE